jgi:signal transduction histidine kinase
VNRSVAEERLRIARDLHDSVGHEIAVVNMYLGSAEVHLDHDRTAVESDLAAAQRSVKAVLREMQDILRVLRVGTDVASLEPTPHHGRIVALIESFRAAGLTVDATLVGLSETLASNVSVAAYRITQEALTNSQKHGSGLVSLRVTVTATETVLIEVVNVRKAGTDDGLPVGRGNGLIGMRERAASVGGSIDIRTDEGMFRVTGYLPAVSRENK